MKMENEIYNEDAETKTSTIEDDCIKKDLIHVGSMAAKMILIMFAVQIFFTIIGETVLNIINIDITTANFETYELILNCVTSLAATFLAYYWILNHTRIPFVIMSPSKEKQGKHMLKYICIIFTIQVVGGLCYEGIQLVSSFVGITWGGFGLKIPNLSTAAIIPYFIWVCLIAPITEELIFRGALLKLLSPYGSKIAILISAVLFGAIHGNLQQFPSTFLAGLLFGFISVKTGTIFYSIILHMFNNVFAVVDELICVVTENSMTYNIGMWGITIIVGLVGTFFIYRERAEYKKLSSGKYDGFVIPVKSGVVKCFFKSLWIWGLMIIIILTCIGTIQRV